MKNIKDKYKLDNDRLEEIEEELRDNVLTKNKKYFVNENYFNSLIDSYNNTIRKLKKNKDKPNFYDDKEEELDFPDSEDVEFTIVDNKKFKSSAKAIKIIPDTNISHVGMYMNLSKKIIYIELEKFYKEFGPFKFIIGLEVEYKKTYYDKDNNKITQYSAALFNSSNLTQSKPLLNLNDFNDLYKEVTDKINHLSENYNTPNGSGWLINKVNYTLINFVKYKPFAGSSYIYLPE